MNGRRCLAHIFVINVAKQRGNQLNFKSFGGLEEGETFAVRGRQAEPKREIYEAVGRGDGRRGCETAGRARLQIS